MARFPSEGWFAEVAEVFNGDERYQGAGGGQCNCTAGIVVDEQVFVLTFEGFKCNGALAADDAALDAVDFYLHMPLEAWKAMLANVKKNGHATLEHTLNTLDLNREEGLSTSKHGDQYREDLFFRYNQTFQFFFDASARVRTEFA